MKTVRVNVSYKDMQLGRMTIPQEQFEVSDERANQLVSILHQGQNLVSILFEKNLTFDLTPPLKSPEQFHNYEHN